MDAEFPGKLDIVYHVGRGDQEWAEYAINSAPGLVVGDLVKFAGLAPSREGLIGALRECSLN